MVTHVSIDRTTLLFASACVVAATHSHSSSSSSQLALARCHGDVFVSHFHLSRRETTETVLHELGFIYASKQQQHNDSTAKLRSFIVFIKYFSRHFRTLDL